MIADLLLMAAPVMRSTAPAPKPPVDPVAAEIFRMGHQSATVLSLSVTIKGKVAICTIEESSSSDFLDRRACEILGKAAFRPRIDPATGRAASYITRQRVVWRIED